MVEVSIRASLMRVRLVALKAVVKELKRKSRAEVGETNIMMMRRRRRSGRRRGWECDGGWEWGHWNSFMGVW